MGRLNVPLIERRISLAAGFCGILDCSSILGYLSGVEPSYFQFFSLIAKSILLLSNLDLLNYSGIRINFFPILSFIIVPILGIAINFSGYPDEVLRPGSFVVSFLATMCFVSQRSLFIYLRSLCLTVSFFNIVYIIFAVLGKIDVTYGRYSYFAGSHPNLGSEISAMAGISANIVLRRRYSLFFSAVTYIVPIILMQGRAALLAFVISFAGRLFVEFTYFARRSVANFIMTVFGGGISLLLLLPYIVSVMSSLLLIDDEYRGGGTGFVGRDERWANALNAFYASPFWGNGLYYFESKGIESTHNFYLYGLSGYGGMSFLMFFAIFFCMGNIYRKSKRVFIIFSPVFVLTIFNDRFINNNIYPFVFYVIIFAFGSTVSGRQYSVGRGSVG